MVLLFLIIVLFITSCQSEDSYLTIEQDNDELGMSYNYNQNKWIYQQMNEHYFWYKDIPDSLLLDFNITPNSFFKSLLSKSDRFSWCELNRNYTGEDLGFHFQAYEIHGSIVNRVLYVSSFSLIEQGLKRGDYFIMKSDHIEVGYFDNGNFISTNNININNKVNRGRNLAPTISLDSIYTINDKRIGYFIYDQFDSSTDVAQIAIKLKNKGIDELILDLRYNPGGYVSTSNYLASLLVKSEHLGKLFQIQKFNDKLTNERINNGKKEYDFVYLNKGSVTSNRNLNLKRLIVLTTKNTASASESLIIGLRPYMDVVTIGTTSCGKDVGSYTIADNRYKYQLQPITFRYYNALNDSTPTTGIIPDIEVADDLNHERGDTNEALLKTAINYLIGNNSVENNTRSLQFSDNEKEYGKSSIEIRNNL